MSELAAFQSRFLAALFEESPAPWAGLEVHRRNVAANFHDALAAAYPVVRRLVGEAFFAEAARRHALATPSRDADLHAFGGGFGAFLAAYRPARTLAWLPGVARLEWAVHECAHAADAEALAFERLAALPPDAHPGLRLRLHPAARLVASRHPVLAIWEANQPGRDGVPARRSGREWVLVQRAAGAAVPRRLDGREWRFLQRLAAGCPLQAAAAFGAQAPRRLAPALVRHAREGLLVDFEGPAAVAH